MEEAISLILQGCKLAKDLESIILANLRLQDAHPEPVLVSKFCGDIIDALTAARGRLMAAAGPPSSLGSSQTLLEPSLQEWVRANISPSAMDAWLQMQLMSTASRNPAVAEEAAMGGDMGAGGGSLLPVERGDHASNLHPAGRAPSLQRPRSSRRKENARTVRVGAPQMGNTEIPPEDGFTWRKYGQKEILATRFPRGYYRCTHQKMYNCPAKKQVQRLDNDPSTFEITYCGEHTCHKTATAPSTLPPSGDMTAAATTSYPYQHQHVPTLIDSSSSWLEFSLGGGTANNINPTPTAGTAFTRELPDYPITDLADTMFNSGSSSSNSMEFLFTHDRTWEGDKKDE